MIKLVSLTQAEEVLNVKLHDLLLDPDVHIETKTVHGEVCVNPQEMMEAKHFIESKKGGPHGK